MAERFDPLSRFLGLVLAALVAPCAVTTVYFALLLLNEPSLEGLAIIPIAALFAVPSGFIASLLFGSVGVCVAELLDAEPWLLPAVGAATGVAHTIFVLSYPDSGGYAWV